MSDPTQLYRLTREPTVEEWRIFLDLIADPGPPSFMPVLVPVERCKHGHYDAHRYRESRALGNDGRGVMRDCPGAAIGA